MLSFSQYDIFSQLLPNWLYNNVYSISSTYTYGNVYNHSTQYTGFVVYICFPFHNMIFFHNYCTIDSTTMFTAYPQHSHTVVSRITLPSILTLLFTYAFLSQCEYFPHITVQLSIWQCLHWIFNVTYCIVYNYPSQYTNFAVYICFHFTIWYIFTITAQFTLQLCLQHILNIYIQYCLQLLSPVYLLAVYICFPLHNVIFFHN